uniref:(northern house mosquito) hypothetical protein n=1 Tax=Culex pipiens TaxID=7175 RepID=A0A8D8GP02_CULPI
MIYPVWNAPECLATVRSGQRATCVKNQRIPRVAGSSRELGRSANDTTLQGVASSGSSTEVWSADVGPTWLRIPVVGMSIVGCLREVPVTGMLFGRFWYRNVFNVERMIWM